ncbi:MAG: glycosyltransferase [Solirubrobacteraceae bacterium]
MPAARRPDVLIVSLGSTEGLRVADRQLRDSLQRAGADVLLVTAKPPGAARTMMLTDLAWARAARNAAIEALAELGDSPPGAIVYSSTTAALLWPRRGAIRFDAPSAGNRPGRHGLWQRPLERRRLVQAPLLLPWSEGGLGETPSAVASRAGKRALVIPVAVEPSGAVAPVRDIAAITYAANPHKKGLDRVLAAWRRVYEELPAGAPRQLVVTGASALQLRAGAVELDSVPGVRLAGALPPQDYRALVRRARVFVCAPRREDYGVAQLEALVDGCILASTAAPGPYPALALARALDPRTVDDDLHSALRSALLDAPEDYAQRALQALAPFSRECAERLVAQQLLPRLFADAGLRAHATGACSRPRLR